MTDALAGRKLPQPTRALIRSSGRGSPGQALAEVDPGFTLVTQPGPRAAISEPFLARAGVILNAQSLEREELERLVQAAQHDRPVVGVGGGVVMDSAKWLAYRLQVPLILVPSSLSVDACVTNTVAVRDGRGVSYEGFVVADRIILDVSLIRSAPSRLNRAGAGDLLSIHTALWDWAAGDGQGGGRFDPAIARRASAVLDALDQVADGVAAVTEEALMTVLLGYADINDMTVECGHAQMEEGSEHYLGYYLEVLTGRSFVHGELVTLGAVVMSRLQGNDPDRVRRIADRCGVRWYPPQLALPTELLTQALVGLAPYVRDAALPHCVANDRPLNEREARGLLVGLI